MNKSIVAALLALMTARSAQAQDNRTTDATAANHADATTDDTPYRLHLRMSGLEDQLSILEQQHIADGKRLDQLNERLDLAHQREILADERMRAMESDLHDLQDKVDYRMYHFGIGTAFGPGGPRMAIESRLNWLKLTYFPAKGLQTLAAPQVYFGERVVWQPFGVGFIIYQTRDDAFSSRWLRQSFAFVGESALEIDLVDIPNVIRLGLRAGVSVYVPNPFDVVKPVYNDVKTDVNTVTDAANDFVSISKKLATKHLPPTGLENASLDDLKAIEQTDPGQLNSFTPSEVYLLNHKIQSHATDHTASTAKALTGPLTQPTVMLSIVARFP
ncbi:MAG: hypothetical protein RLZZ324_332 [Candidatus Parcubacteria bacterium]